MNKRTLVCVALFAMLVPTVAVATTTCTQPRSISGTEQWNTATNMVDDQGGCGVVVPDGATLEIGSQAVVDLGMGLDTSVNQDSAINVKSGGTLIIHAGAKFLVRDGGYAVVYPESGATVTINGQGDGESPSLTIVEDQCVGGSNDQSAFDGVFIVVEADVLSDNAIRYVRFQSAAPAGTPLCMSGWPKILSFTSSALTVSEFVVQHHLGQGTGAFVFSGEGDVVVENGFINQVDFFIEAVWATNLTRVSRLYATGVQNLLNLYEGAVLGVFERSISENRTAPDDAAALILASEVPQRPVIRFNFFHHVPMQGSTMIPALEIDKNDALVHNNTFVGEHGSHSSIVLYGGALASIVGNLFVGGGNGVSLFNDGADTMVAGKITYNAFYGYVGTSQNDVDCPVNKAGCRDFQQGSDLAFLVDLSTTHQNKIYENGPTRLPLSSLQAEMLNGYPYSPTLGSTLLDAVPYSALGSNPSPPALNGDLMGRHLDDTQLLDIGASQPALVGSVTPNSVETGSTDVVITVDGINLFGIPVSAKPSAQSVYWLDGPEGTVAVKSVKLVGTVPPYRKVELTFDMTDGQGQNLPLGSYNLVIDTSSLQTPPMVSFPPAKTVVVGAITLTPAIVITPDTVDAGSPDADDDAAVVPDMQLQTDVADDMVVPGPDATDDMVAPTPDAVDDMATPDVVAVDTAGPDTQAPGPDTQAPGADTQAPGPDVQSSPQAPSVPSITSPRHTSAISTTLPTISYTASTDPQGDPVTYTIEIDTVGSFNSGTLKTKTTSETSWKVEQALAENTVYYVRVKASDGTNDSAWSKAAVFIVSQHATPEGSQFGVERSPFPGSCSTSVQQPLSAPALLIVSLLLGVAVLRRRRIE